MQFCFSRVVILWVDRARWWGSSAWDASKSPCIEPMYLGNHCGRCGGLGSEVPPAISAKHLSVFREEPKSAASLKTDIFITLYSDMSFLTTFSGNFMRASSHMTQSYYERLCPVSQPDYVWLLHFIHGPKRSREVRQGFPRSHSKLLHRQDHFLNHPALSSPWSSSLRTPSSSQYRSSQCCVLGFRWWGPHKTILLLLGMHSTVSSIVRIRNVKNRKY